MKYQILKDLIPQFESKLKKFQRKYDKFGKDTITYIKSEPYFVTQRTPMGNKYQQVYVDVEVEGHYQVGNYEFVASLEFVPAVGKNIIRKCPGTEDIPNQYLTRNCCDHCGASRHRKYTVLLKDRETGTYIQVGKSCVRDFLGCDVNSFASYLSIFSDLQDYLETLNKSGHGNHEIYYLVDDILEQTVAEIHARGYISKATIDRWYSEHECEEERCCPLIKTSSRVWNIITEERNLMTGEIIEPRYQITDSIKEQVQIIKNFIENAENSDYTSNLKILLQVGHTSPRDFGLVVSMVGYWMRETAKKEQQERAKLDSKSNFVGEVGEKIELTATPECIYSTTGDYGTFYIYKFKSGEDEFIWKTSKNLEPGIELIIKGTVKNHNEFRGIKQTELTRCKTTRK